MSEIPAAVTASIPASSPGQMVRPAMDAVSRSNNQAAA